MSREIVAGVTTFLTMAYIVVVNPAILSTPGTGMPFSGALTATVLVCVTMTLLMGLYARLPFGVAPGMGLNAFFTYTIIINGHVPWPTALGIIFLLIVLLSPGGVMGIYESISRRVRSGPSEGDDAPVAGDGAAAPGGVAGD